MSADDRVAFVTELVKVSVVCPDVLRELELSDKACTDDESCYAAVGAIVWSVFRQRQTISSAAAIPKKKAFMPGRKK